MVRLFLLAVESQLVMSVGAKVYSQKQYILFIPITTGVQMSTPQVKQPTKKAFQLPKGAEEPATGNSEQPAAKASRRAATSKPAADAATAKQATSVKAAPVKGKKAPATGQKKAGKAVTEVVAEAAAQAVAKKNAEKAAQTPAKKKAAEAASKKPTKAARTTEATRATKAANEPAAKAAAEEKARRAKKEKVVRDSFTMPKSDYAKIAELKQRCLSAGVQAKKSELLRAGLLLLAAKDEKGLVDAVSAVELVKTGRPANA